MLSSVSWSEKRQAGHFDADTSGFRANEVNQQVEVLSMIGNIAQADDGTPKLHVHVVLGCADAGTRGGHLTWSRASCAPRSRSSSKNIPPTSNAVSTPRRVWCCCNPESRRGSRAIRNQLAEFHRHVPGTGPAAPGPVPRARLRRAGDQAGRSRPVTFMRTSRAIRTTGPVELGIPRFVDLVHPPPAREPSDHRGRTTAPLHTSVADADAVRRRICCRAGPPRWTPPRSPLR